MDRVLYICPLQDFTLTCRYLHIYTQVAAREQAHINGLQVIFATTTLTELLYYFFLLRCVYRATHGAHNSSLTLLQLPKPVRFSSYLLPTFLSVVRSLVIPGGVESPTSP